MNTEQQLIEKWRNLPLDKQQQILQFVESFDQHKQEIKQRPSDCVKESLLFLMILMNHYPMRF